MYLGDCMVNQFPANYAHLNSLHLVDDEDLVISLKQLLAGSENRRDQQVKCNGDWGQASAATRNGKRSACSPRCRSSATRT